jgi:putative flippase GtrA
MFLGTAALTARVIAAFIWRRKFTFPATLKQKKAIVANN